MGISSRCSTSWWRESRMSLLSPACHLDLPQYPLHFSEVFPSFCLDRAPDEINWGERELSAALAPWPKALGRMSSRYHLPTACWLQSWEPPSWINIIFVATYCFMSWVIRPADSLNAAVWFSRQQKTRREDMKCSSLSFVEGQSQLPKVMGESSLWSLLMLKNGWLT